MAEEQRIAGDLPRLVDTLRRRIESRYRRISFVHRELVKLDAAAKEVTGKGSAPLNHDMGVPPDKAQGKNLLDGSGKPGMAKAAGAGRPAAAGKTSESFEDFVFRRIDFSIYKKIDAEEYGLLFDQGLEDFEETFFQRAFKMDREAVRRTISQAYIKAGPFFVCQGTSFLLLSIMRTIHTSLDFAPILTESDVSTEEELRALVAALDGVVIRHEDGMETRLFVPQAGSAGKTARPALCGTFHPLNKAWTITLIR
ncbi:MAG: hypothetical protein LBO65_06655 [Spirochaetaceae bacterium]|jgi:hypothetical protein|nr:hypothetical protein [Spirochaetaceae bacterium]